jgi:quercetin dioxygenase-like cupin family protein
MSSKSIGKPVVTLAVIAMTVSVPSIGFAQSSSPSISETPVKPLVLEKNEGEQRTWRPEAGESDLGGFIIKVSPKNNGSQHLVLLTDDMASGDAIPTHKHLGQDEIVFVVKGTIHVHMGDQERDLHAGGTVFIPAYTWVNVKNIGAEPVSSVTIFSAPGFEDHLRCESVLANERPATISREEENECDHMGHVVYQDRGEKDPGAETTTPNAAKPLLLEKNEGERRVLRGWPGHLDPGETFILKVDPNNGGSKHLVFVTGDIKPGGAIDAHRHPDSDEILFLQSGTARVHLGDAVRDVHAGAVVFIPANTWISVENIGNDMISSFAVFSSPGFEDFMRAVSVREGEKNVPMSEAENNAAEKLHSHDVIYKEP